MLIEAANIHKIYPGPLQVLKGVDLAIDDGEVVAIVGPSGAGKSTLLHILGGLDAPKEGQVIFKGQNLYALSDVKRAQARNRDMGFVFQSYHLLPELTALENVILPAMIKNNSGKTSTIEFAGLKLLEQLGLSARASHRPNQLSGGEQQRVAIARALMNGPKVVFCDEPTGNLDSVSGHAVMDTLLNLNRTHGVTVIIVTHDDKVAARTQRVIAMKDGLLEQPLETLSFPRKRESRARMEGYKEIN
jgi:lipoprotein-releasing system ATP-binding protein